MRQVFAHEAVLAMPADADLALPGGAVTVALCGHWEHEPPCPLAPHHVHAERVVGDVHVRILFATEPDCEPEVRQRLESALSGEVELPDGLTITWRLLESRPGDLRDDESEHAAALLQQ